jgi:hypothetical protein
MPTRVRYIELMTNNNNTNTPSLVSALTTGTFATYHDDLTGEVNVAYLRPGTVVGRITTADGNVLVNLGAFRVWVPEQHLTPYG